MIPELKEHYTDDERAIFARDKDLEATGKRLLSDLAAIDASIENRENPDPNPEQRLEDLVKGITPTAPRSFTERARALVECGSYSQVSLGWHSSKTITRDIEGKTLTYIVAGVLTEVSLVPAGAVKTTHCQVSELSRCATLAHDCKSLRFQSDNDFVALRRAFQKMESEND